MSQCAKNIAVATTYTNITRSHLMVDVRTVFDQRLQNAGVAFESRRRQGRVTIRLEYQEAQESIT